MGHIPESSKLFYLERPHPLLVEILWRWALQVHSGAGHGGWALQGNSGPGHSGDTLGLGTPGNSRFGVGHSRDERGVDGRGEEFWARRKVELKSNSHTLESDTNGSSADWHQISQPTLRWKRNRP